MVGTKTVLDDNPKLNARDFYGKNPTRIAIDRSNKIPENFNFKDGKQNTIIFSEEVFLTKNEKYSHKKTIFDTHFIDFLLNSLYEENIQSVVIEGGKFTLEAFIKANIWDEARVFIGKSTLKKGLKAPVLERKPFRKESILEDQLFYFKNYD